MKDRRNQLRGAQQQRWERFDEAVYEYARQCVKVHLALTGHQGPPEDLRWAYEYMPTFFAELDEDVFADVGSMDRDYIREEAEYRFVVGFRDGWRWAEAMSGKRLLPRIGWQGSSPPAAQPTTQRGQRHTDRGRL